MAFSPITHLRHFDIAVPDYEKQIDFYKNHWGLTVMEDDGGVTYFAAEGSPEQYSVRVRKSDEKRLDLVSFGAADRAAVDQLASDLDRQGRAAGRRARRPQDARRRLRLPVLRPGRAHHRGLRRRRNPQAPQGRRARGHPGQALARGAELARAGKDAGLVRAAPGLPPLRHPEPPADRRPVLLHALQRRSTTAWPSPAVRMPPCSTPRSSCAESTNTCAAAAA